MWIQVDIFDQTLDQTVRFLYYSFYLPNLHLMYLYTGDSFKKILRLLCYAINKILLSSKASCDSEHLKFN